MAATSVHVCGTVELILPKETIVIESRVNTDEWAPSRLASPCVAPSSSHGHTAPGRQKRSTAAVASNAAALCSRWRIPHATSGAPVAPMVKAKMPSEEADLIRVRHFARTAKAASSRIRSTVPQEEIERSAVEEAQIDRERLFWATDVERAGFHEREGHAASDAEAGSRGATHAMHSVLAELAGALWEEQGYERGNVGAQNASGARA